MGETHFKSIDKACLDVIPYYARMDVPHTMPEILALLESGFKGYDQCGCEQCCILAAQICETIVVIKECAKLVPETCHNGVASLIYRLHSSREAAIPSIVEVLQKKVFSEMMKPGVKTVAVEGDRAVQFLELLRNSMNDKAPEKPDGVMDDSGESKD